MLNVAKPEQPKDHESFQNANGAAAEACSVYSKFDDMPLSMSLLRGVYSFGFEKPSPIQMRAIVPLVRGGDLIAQAQSGTGKTGAFAIGLLQRVDFRRRTLQGLILSPTRELVLQTHYVVGQLGAYLGQLGDDGVAMFCQTFCGGTSVRDDIEKLQPTTVIAVGTPGRVGDLIKRGAMRTESLRTVVLDEADELLSTSFSEQIYAIFKYLPKDIQVALFSATMGDDILQLTKKFMRDPTCILVEKDALTLKGIRQFFVAVEEEHKLGTLMDLYESVSIAQSVIFANTKRRVDWISQQLNAENFTVSSMHAEMSKQERESVMAEFRSGKSRVLVTTDLIARGIDVHHVSIVINYELPLNKESYLHRIGRSGRYGRKGIAMNFVSSRDRAELAEIEAFYRTQIVEMPMDFASYLDGADA